MILAKAPSSSEQEVFGLSKDIIPVSVIGLIITLAAIAFLSWLVYKNKDKIIPNKKNLGIAAIGYVVLLIALILVSVALSKYNSPRFDDIFRSDLSKKLKGLAYSGLVFSLIGAGISGFIFTKVKK